MRTTKITVLSCLVVLATLGIQPAATADLAGIVTEPGGSPVERAYVRAINPEEGIDARTVSAADGSYELTGLPAGDYMLVVTTECCLYLPYSDEGVAITDGSTTELDVELVLFNVNVEGDDPGSVNADLLRGQVIPDEPVPRMADGKPDLTGTWLVSGERYPTPPAALPWAQEVFEQRFATNFIDHPSAHCLPGSLPAPAGSAFIAGFVQRPELIVILLEEAAGFRQIFMDGREHPDKLNPTWLGHSIGHWDGDTLVVDTVGLNDKGYSSDYPRTTDVRVTERYTRSSYGELEVEVTFDDPGVFAEPWTQYMTWQLAPQLDIMEYVCENNQWQNTTAEDVGLAPQ